MSIINQIYQQLIKLFWVLIMLYIPILALLALFVILQINYGIRVSTFTRDPIQFFGGDPYIGMLSNIGILFWAATVSITFFTSYMLRGSKQYKAASKFLFYSGLFTSFLMLDDLFLLHENIFPKFLNIPELLIYIAYALILIWYFTAFYRKILEGEYVLLLLAIIFFGGSVFIDYIGEFIKIPGLYVLEDGFKIFGIVTWFTYFLRIDINYLNLSFSEHYKAIN